MMLSLQSKETEKKKKKNDLILEEIRKLNHTLVNINPKM